MSPLHTHSMYRVYINKYIQSLVKQGVIGQKLQRELLMFINSISIVYSYMTATISIFNIIPYHILCERSMTLHINKWPTRFHMVCLLLPLVSPLWLYPLGLARHGTDPHVKSVQVSAITVLSLCSIRGDICLCSLHGVLIVFSVTWMNMFGVPLWSCIQVEATIAYCHSFHLKKHSQRPLFFSTQLIQS